MTLFKDKFKTNSKRLENWDYSSEAVYFITIATENRKCIFGSIVVDKMILNDVGEIVEKELLKSIKIRKNWFFHNWIVMPNHIHLLIEIQNNDQILTTKYIVETYSSASTSSISATNIDTSIDVTNAKIEHSHIVETHSSASASSISTTNIETSIDVANAKIEHSHIVETHSGASTSSISTMDINKNKQIFGETHCCAPLRDNWDQYLGRNSNKNCEKSELGSKLSRKPNSISSFVAVFKSVTTKQINDLYKEKKNTEIGNKKIWQTNYHDHIVRNYKRFETIYNYIKSNPESWEKDCINLNSQ